MCEQIPVERIESRIVDVRGEHALAQVVEDDDANATPETAKRFLVEIGPGARTGTEDQQPNRLSTVSKCHYKQACPPVLASLWIANHRPGAVIDLSFLAWGGDDHRPCLKDLRRADLVGEALDALIATLKTVLSNQVLPDRHCIATAIERLLDDLAIRLTGTDRPPACTVRVGGRL